MMSLASLSTAISTYSSATGERVEARAGMVRGGVRAGDL
jgi:hypothetical protein